MKKNFKRIISLVLTVIMLAGTMAMIVPVSAASSTLTPNTKYTINGVDVRFDVPGAHANKSTLTINDDGTMSMKACWGDLLWFSNVEVSSDSVITTTVTLEQTADLDTSALGAGTVFAIDPAKGWDSDSDTAVFVGLRSPSGGKSRAFLAATTYAKSTVNSDFTTVLNKYLYDNQNSDFGQTWTAGKSVTTIISQDGNTVKVAFKDGNDNNITDTDYVTYTDANYPISGAVGYMSHYTKDGRYYVYTISEYKITNAKVNGTFVAELDLVELFSSNNGGDGDDDIENTPAEGYRTIAGNTAVPINDLILRMDHVVPAHSASSLTICPDGTLKMKGSRGDLFWLPNVQVTSNSIMTVTATMDECPNTSASGTGVVFGIDSTKGWDSEGDLAVFVGPRSPSGGSRIFMATAEYATTTKSADFKTVLNKYVFTNTNNNFGETWTTGHSVTTVISQSGESVSATFKDENGDYITDVESVSYTNAEYPMSGAVGFMVHYTGDKDYHTFTISEYKITNAIVNGVEVAEFDLIAELAKYMSEENSYTLRSNLSLNGVIGLNVRVDANYFIKGTETLVVTDKKGTTVVNEVLANLWNAENGYYACTVPVNAKEMTDTFTVTLKDGENTITTVSDLSVKSYADQLMANDAYNDWDALVTAMLNYGAAAQKLFNYETEKLAATLEEFAFDMSAIGMPTLTGDKTIISDLSASLVLESDTALKLYFKNATDEELTVTVNGEAAELTEANDGLLCLTISDIAADELDDEFVVSINDGALVITISACEWAKTVVENESDADLITLAKALAAYATAAASKN